MGSSLQHPTAEVKSFSCSTCTVSDDGGLGCDAAQFHG